MPTTENSLPSTNNKAEQVSDKSETVSGKISMKLSSKPSDINAPAVVASYMCTKLRLLSLVVMI